MLGEMYPANPYKKTRSQRYSIHVNSWAPKASPTPRTTDPSKSRGSLSRVILPTSRLRVVRGCRGNYALGTSAVHSSHNDQPERGGRPTEVLWVVFICLLLSINHACVQTINSKDDDDGLSSTRSGIGARMRDAGERPVDCLTPRPNRDALPCHHRPANSLLTRHW
jgi:hypothetical protein